MGHDIDRCIITNISSFDTLGTPYVVTIHPSMYIRTRFGMVGNDRHPSGLHSCCPKPSPTFTSPVQSLSVSRTLVPTCSNLRVVDAPMSFTVHLSHGRFLTVLFLSFVVILQIVQVQVSTI